MRSIIFCFCLLFFTSCTKSKTYKYQKEVLDSVFAITVVEKATVSPDIISNAVDKAYSELARIYTTLNSNIAESELSKISNELLKGKKGEKIDLKVSDEFYSLIDFSLAVSEKTNWSFDLCFKIISELWDKNLRAETPRNPSQAEINDALIYTGKNSFELKGNGLIKFKRGVKFSFGGIIRGYTLEKMSSILKENGLLNHIIEVDGDISISGSKSGKPWNAVLINPSDAKKNIGHCIVANENISIFTSGNFYGFFELNGKRYSHTMDMRNGRPADSDLLSITILSKDSKISDSFSTAYFVYGFKRIEQQFEIFDKDGIGVIIVGSNGVRKMNKTAMQYCYLTE